MLRVLCLLLLAWGSIAINDAESLLFYREKPKFVPVKLGIKGFVQAADSNPVVLSPKEEGIEIENDTAEDNGFSILNGTQNVESRFLGGFSSSSITSYPNVLPYPNPLGKVVKVFQTESVTKVVPPLCIACACVVGPASACTLCDYATAPPGPFVASTTACLLGETKCTPYCVDADVLGPPRTKPSICGTLCEHRAAGSAVPCNPPVNGVISSALDACVTSGSSKRRRSALLPQLVSSKEEEPFETQRQARIFGLFGGNVIQVTSTSTKSILGPVTATYPAGGLRCLPGDLASSPLCS